MTRGELGSAVFKVLGIVTILKGIPAVGGIAYAINTIVSPFGAGSSQGLYLLGMSLVEPAVYVLIGILLLGKSQYLAFRVFGVPEQRVSFQIDPRDLQAVAFAVIGICLVAIALPQLAGSAYKVFTIASIFATDYDTRLVDAKSVILTSALRTIFGIGLFLSGGRISNIWGTIQAMRPMREDGESTAKDAMDAKDGKEEEKL